MALASHANIASAAMGVFLSSANTVIPQEAGIYKRSVRIDGYKRIQCDWYAFDGLSRVLDATKIARVEIPAYTTIVRPEHSPSDQQLRTSEYRMVEIAGLQPLGWSQCRSLFNPSYVYKVGETYRSRVDLDVNNPTSKGLHFYLDRKDAE